MFFAKSVAQVYDYIDGLIAALGPSMSMVSRGSIGSPDITQATLTLDLGLHDLDISAFVPEGVTWVHIKSAIKYTATNRFLYLFTKAYDPIGTAMLLYSQVANLENGDRSWFPIGADRKLQYILSDLDNTYVKITILGWVLPG